MSFSTKLKLGVILPALIFGVGVSLTTLWTIEKILEKRIEDHLQDKVIDTMDKIVRFIEERRLNLALLSQNPQLRSPSSAPSDLKQSIDQFKNNYSNFYDSISVFDINRIRIADTENLNLGLKDPPHEHWKDILEGNLSIAKSIGISSSLKKLTFYFAAPLKNKNGVVFRAVVARIIVENFNGIFKNYLGAFKLASTLDLDLLDQQGTLLYSNHNKKEILGKPYNNLPIFKKINFNQPKGTFSANHPHSETRDVVAYTIRQPDRTDPKRKWALITHFAEKVAFQPVAELIQTLIVISLLFFVFAVAVAGILYKSIYHSITHLEQAMESYGKGIQPTQSPVLPKDEIGRIFLSFMKMVQKREELESKVLQVQKKAFERNKMASIGEMTQNLCHEISNPLNIILVKCQIFSRKSNSGKNIFNQSMIDFVESTKQQCERIKGTIDRLIEFSRIQSDHNTQTQANDLLKKIVQLIKKDLIFQNIHVTLNLDPSLPPLTTDKGKLYESLYHLIINAKESMPKGGNLEIISRKIRSQEGEVQILIKDTGVGIKPENLPKLFVPFYSTKETIYGSGLGLSIVQSLVKVNGGDIKIDSQPDKGTQITLTLKIKPAGLVVSQENIPK